MQFHTMCLSHCVVTYTPGLWIMHCASRAMLLQTHYHSIHLLPFYKITNISLREAAAIPCSIKNAKAWFRWEMSLIDQCVQGCSFNKCRSCCMFFKMFFQVAARVDIASAVVGVRLRWGWFIQRTKQLLAFQRNGHLSERAWSRRKVPRPGSDSTTLLMGIFLDGIFLDGHFLDGHFS